MAYLIALAFCAPAAVLGTLRNLFRWTVNNGSNRVLCHSSPSQSEHGIVECLSVSCLPHVSFHVQWLRHPQSCAPICRLLSFMKHPNQSGDRGTPLGAPAAAWFHHGVPTNTIKEWKMQTCIFAIYLSSCRKTWVCVLRVLNETEGTTYMLYGSRAL